MIAMKQFLQTYPIFFSYLCYEYNVSFVTFQIVMVFWEYRDFYCNEIIIQINVGNFSVYWSCFQYIAKICNNVLASGSFPYVKCRSISFHTNNWGSHLPCSIDEMNLNWVCINVYQKKKRILALSPRWESCGVFFIFSFYIWGLPLWAEWFENFAPSNWDSPCEISRILSCLFNLCISPF